MKKFYWLALVLIMLSCKSKKNLYSDSEKFTVENLAEVIASGDLDQVYSQVPKTTGKSLFEEGSVERPYTILYPETPDEILIVWKDASKEAIDQIRFEKNGRWKSRTGLHIGSTFDDLIRLNEGPIDVYGFGWDYGGAVNWRNGKLKDSPIRVFLAPESTLPGRFYGDHILQESPEEMKNLNLQVKAIVWREK